MKSIKFINSFIRRFSDYIALNSDLYLSHKPDLHTKLNKIENWDNLYSFWVRNSPRNDKGDLVRLYFLLNQIEFLQWLLLHQNVLISIYRKVYLYILILFFLNWHLLDIFLLWKAQK